MIKLEASKRLSANRPKITNSKYALDTFFIGGGFDLPQADTSSYVSGIKASIDIDAKVIKLWNRQAKKLARNFKKVNDMHSVGTFSDRQTGTDWRVEITIGEYRMVIAFVRTDSPSEYIWL